MTTTIAPPDSSEEGQRCVHWWLLSSPQPGEIPATCKKCGAYRTFPAVPDAEYKDWSSDPMMSIKKVANWVDGGASQWGYQ